MSLGFGGDPGTTVKRAIDNCAAGACLVAAAGNNGPGADTVTWPARYRNVIGVGAVDRNCVVAGFSSRGPADPNAYVEDNVEIVAPGVDVWSNKLGGGQQDLVTMSGTSMASPIAAGIIACFRSKYTTLQGTDGFRYKIRNSILDLGIGGPDNWYGLGLARCLVGS
jgi:subtilisin family serine protease